MGDSVVALVLKPYQVTSILHNIDKKKYVTQLSVNLIKEVFTHWPSKCLLLAVYALASALTDMVTARYNTAKCINSECL